MVSSTVMRFLFLIAISVVIAGVAFPFAGDVTLFVDAALWIYSLVVAFLIDKAMSRRRELKTSVNVELARLRHIYHVCEQLPAAFSKRIGGLLLVYERKIEGEFVSHHKSTDAFRALSHEIYAFKPRTSKDGILYADLLQTLQDVTLGRQRIQFELMGGLAAYDWFLLSVILACLLALLLVRVDDPAPLTRLALTFMAVLVVLVPMEMLWKGDRYDSQTIKKFQNAYGRNAPKGK